MAVRHPTEKKRHIPTLSQSSFSLTFIDRKILKYLYDHEKFRFNIKEFSKINKMPRTNVYDSLARLERYEFVSLNLADKKITPKGKIYMETTAGSSVESFRRECREIERNLSTHYHKFKLQIINPEKINPGYIKARLSSIKNKGIKENVLPNLHQIIVDFDDAKIIINPKQVIISLFEIQTKDVEESDISCLSRVIEYVELLKKIGLETEGIMIESGEWARVESQLAQFLKKIDGKYYKVLSDGNKIWIDCSEGLEDETNNKLVRERVDNFLDQVGTGKFNLPDMKEAISEVKELKKFSLEAIKEQSEAIKGTQDILNKVSGQNMQLSQVIEQISNNVIRLTKEVSKK